MFPDSKRDREATSPNDGTDSGPGKGCSRMLGTGNFPDFLGKNPVPGNGIQERRPLHDSAPNFYEIDPNSGTEREPT